MLTQDCVLGYYPAVPPGRWGMAGQFSRQGFDRGPEWCRGI